MIQALIGPISSLAGTWLEGKVEKTKAEAQALVDADINGTLDDDGKQVVVTLP